MEDYVFVCIGSNKLIEDSFGPRVGNILNQKFENNKNIKIFGTMQFPIHFQNADKFLKKIEKNKNSKIIIIDSAYSKNSNIGDTYIGYGGLEIGKAYGKGIYFPANMNIRTIVGNSIEENNKNKIATISKINKLSKCIAKQIIQIIY